METSYKLQSNNYNTPENLRAEHFNYITALAIAKKNVVTIWLRSQLLILCQVKCKLRI